jgi:hypothetical protein
MLCFCIVVSVCNGANESNSNLLDRIPCLSLYNNMFNIIDRVPIVYDPKVHATDIKYACISEKDYKKLYDRVIANGITVIRDSAYVCRTDSDAVDISNNHLYETISLDALKERIAAGAAMRLKDDGMKIVKGSHVPYCTSKHGQQEFEVLSSFQLLEWLLPRKTGTKKRGYPNTPTTGNLKRLSSQSEFTADPLLPDHLGLCEIMYSVPVSYVKTTQYAEPAPRESIHRQGFFASLGPPLLMEPPVSFDYDQDMLRRL